MGRGDPEPKGRAGVVDHAVLVEAELGHVGAYKGLGLGPVHVPKGATGRGNGHVGGGWVNLKFIERGR